MQQQLRNTAKQLLEEGKVQVVIGYAELPGGEATHPTFVTDAADVDTLVWNDKCFANLTSYLTRDEVKKLGKPAVVVKGCDARALAVLEIESQVDREEMVVIGVACEGVGKPKCEVCDVHMPPHVDITVGEVSNPEVTADDRYQALEKLMEMSHEERLAYWSEEFSRCFKCYACRQICPICTCERCLVEKNRPQIIDTSPTLKGNFAWHITRAFHLAGRCVSCGECSRACPAGIDLQLLNLTLAKAAEDNFKFRAGMVRNGEPLIGAYLEEDEEDFIG